MLSIFCGSKKTPPHSSIKSTFPRILEHRTGNELAIASIKARDNPSRNDGKIKASADL